MPSRSPSSSRLLLLWVALAAPAFAQEELDLPTAYRLALARSEVTRASETAVQQAQNQVRSAWTQILPTARLLGSGGFGGRSSGTFQQPGIDPRELPAIQYTTLGGSASLAQPLFRRGLWDDVAAGRRGVDAARARLERQREQLFLEVASAFVSVMRARRQIEVAKAALERAEGERRSTGARVSAGGALRTALLQAGLSVRRAEAQLLMAQRDARLQEVSFERLVGVRPTTLRLPADRQELPVAESWTALAEARADLQGARRSAEAARHRVQAVAALRWPALDGQLSYLTPQLGQTTYNLHQYTGAAMLTIPLYQAGTNSTQREAAEFEAHLAALEEQRLWKQIEEEVKLAAVELETAQQTLEIAELQVKEAKENYELVTNQYKLRTVSFLEVSTAQSVLSEAEGLRVNATFDRELAAYRLLFAAGQLQPPP
jgi:outer membrane protein